MGFRRTLAGRKGPNCCQAFPSPFDSPSGRASMLVPVVCRMEQGVKAGKLKVAEGLNPFL